MDRFHEFLLNIKPYCNFRAIEKQSGIPSNTFAKHWMYLKDGKNGIQFPSQHIPALFRALVSIYGVIGYNGYFILLERNKFCIFVEKRGDFVLSTQMLDEQFIQFIKKT